MAAGDLQMQVVSVGGSKRPVALFMPCSRIVPGNFYITIPGSAGVVREVLGCRAVAIAAVDGVAAGLGATLAFLCDHASMAEEASIGERAIRSGIVPAWCGLTVWPRTIGMRDTSLPIMGGELIPAARAVELDLVVRGCR